MEMSDTRGERITVRFSPAERQQVEAAAERAGVGTSVVARQGALLRARQAEGAMLIALEADVSRRVRAAADLEDVDPADWALAVLDEVAGRRLAGLGLAVAIGTKLTAGGEG